MLRPARSAALLLILLAFSLPSHADAQQAAARDCSGTLCDLYYGNSSEAPAQPGKSDAPTPLTVPGDGLLHRMFGGGTSATGPNNQAAPEKQPLVGVGGGGVAAMARGEPQQRCTGTLCDMFYGGPPPETPAPATAAQPARVEGAPAQEAASEAASPERPAAADPELPVYRAPPRCAATGRDPWACYR